MPLSPEWSGKSPQRVVMNRLTPAQNEIVQLKHRVQQLETCSKVTSLLNTELSSSNLLDTIMKIAKKVMKADGCSLLLLDEDNGDLVFQVALSPVSDQIMNLGRIKLGQGIAGSVAKTGRATVVKDAYKHPKFNQSFDKKTGFQTGSLLCAPLKTQERIIGVCQVIHGRKGGRIFTRKDLALFRMLCDSAALAIQNSRMHRILLETQRMEKDMEFAQSVQESFLPATFPQHDNFLFAAETVPAKVVGGDYYDFIPLGENTLGVVLGDVSGKGVPAALHMARLMSDFRYISQAHLEPARILAEVNTTLYQRSHRGMFTTAIYLLIDLKNKTMRAANAGHHPALICDGTGRIIEAARASGSPLGIVPGTQYQEEEISLKKDDRVLIYSDGITESRNDKRKDFGVARLKEFLARENGAPEVLIDKLTRTVKKHIGSAPQFDDMTCVAFKVR